METSGLRCILADVSEAGSARACGVGDCKCLPPILSGLGDTSGPRIDRIPPTCPPWRRRQFRELKKLLFLAPSTCPIDLFGPLANRTVLKRLHGAFRLLASVLHAASSTPGTLVAEAAQARHSLASAYAFQRQHIGDAHCKKSPLTEA